MDDNSGINYSKSNMPTKPGEPVPDRPHNDPGGVVSGETADDLNFPSLTAQGMTVVRLPRRNSETTPLKTKLLQLREVPREIGDRVAGALGTSEAAVEFGYWTGALKGAGVLRSHAQQRMEELASGFAKIPPGERQEEFFENQIRPWLESLQVGPK